MNDSERTIISFADKYLAPYFIKHKFDGDEIVPEYCPYCGGGDHRDKNTFALSISKGCFVCKRGNCGVDGRVQELIRYFGQNPTAIKTGGSVVNRSPRYKLPSVKLNPVTDVIYEYFKSRGISRQTVDAYKIASDQKGNIIFPFYESNTLTYVKYRRPHAPQNDMEKRSKEWQESGCQPILFGMDQCVFDKPLYITQGQIDALSLHEAGISNAVSVPCGCDNLQWIENCYDWLEKFSTIVIFGDSDAPGRKMVDEVAKRLDESRCRIVREYPEGTFGDTLKDANDILIECGVEQVRRVAESAEQIEIKGMLGVSDIPMYDPDASMRIKFGIPMLDSVLGGMEEGCISIVSGRSGQGKSTLVNQFVLNTIEQGYKVAMYSGELKSNKIMYRLCIQAAGSDYVGLKYNRITDEKEPSVSWDVQHRVRDWLQGKFWIFDNEQRRQKDELEIDTVLKLFTMVARRDEPFLFVIDNVMSLIADQAEEIAAQRSMIAKLKSFSQKFKCHIILVAHPRKSGSKEDNVLTKDSVSGSASMVNFCDNAFSVERPNIRVLKSRETGRTKLIECCYASDCYRIYQSDKGDVFRNYSWNKKDCKLPDVKANTIYGITMAEQQPF